MALEAVIVVEPHADDAFLSLGGHLRAWHTMGRRTAIVTVFPQSDRRAKEGKAYAESVGALYSTCAATADDTPREIADELAEVLYSTYRVLGESATLVGPLGLKHPEHQLVFEAINGWGVRSDDFTAFYVDTPYQTVQRNALELLQKITGRRVLSFYRPPVAKWKAVPIFKSQAKFFYFNSPTSLQRTPEIIVGSNQRENIGDGVRIWHTTPSRKSQLLTSLPT